MSEMIERVAIALLPWIASTYEGHAAKWEEPLDREFAMEAARAAIQAIDAANTYSDVTSAWAEYAPKEAVVNDDFDQGFAMARWREA
jgi:hypothetical protein